MTDIRFFLVGLLLFSGISICSCLGNEKKPSFTNYSKDSLVYNTEIQITNPNLSFIGELEGERIILNINSNIKKGVVFGNMYGLNNVDPYINMNYFKGSIVSGKLILESENGTKITGDILVSSFKGKISKDDKEYSLHLVKNKNYSNGNLLAKSGSRNKIISLSGFTDSEACQGQLIKIGDFKKENYNYLLYYFTFPSNGIYRSRGNCGSGTESLLVLIKHKTDIQKIEIKEVDLFSCYNAVESLIEEDLFNHNDLIDIWNTKNELILNRVNLRKDLSQVIRISPKSEKIITIEDN